MRATFIVRIKLKTTPNFFLLFFNNDFTSILQSSLDTHVPKKVCESKSTGTGPINLNVLSVFSYCFITGRISSVDNHFLSFKFHDSGFTGLNVSSSCLGDTASLTIGVLAIQ